MKFIIGFNLIEVYYVGTEVIKMKRIPIQPMDMSIRTRREN